MGIKITVIGGGSSYTPELISDIAAEPERLDVDQVSLLDLDPGKAQFIADVCNRSARELGLRTKVTGGSDLAAALGGADFVISQIRVGGLAARIRDEKIPKEFGLVGNETTGAGGFVCGLRTVTASLQLAREIEKITPQAWVFNLSNPAGIVSEALLGQTGLKVLGFCNIPINTSYAMANVFNASPGKIRLDSFGLNHLSWVRSVYVDGVERLQDLIASTQDREGILYTQGLVDEFMEPEFLRSLALIPSWYVRYFYFPDWSMEQEARESHTKGEMDILAEKKIKAILTSRGYDEEAAGILASKGGAQYYLPVLQAIHAILDDSGGEIVADVKNNGAISCLPEEACVEVPCRVFRSHVEPLPVGELPLAVRGLVQAVKTYEQLTILAATSGDRQVAIEALMANPLIGSFGKAKQFFERILENEHPYIPQFFS